jgi:hypothetical protein
METVASDDTLWKYYYYVDKNPNLDDLKTLLNMIEKAYINKEMNPISDFLGGISGIIKKLPEDDQIEARKILQNLKVHPDTDLYMRMNGYRKFRDIQEFEDFIRNAMERYGAYSTSKVVMDPSNKYYWDMTSEELKEELREELKKELEARKNQPSLADMIKKSLREPPQGWDEV